MPVKKSVIRKDMKIVFFGSANVALPILEKLNKQHQILAVVTNPDAPAGRSKTFEETPVSALAKELKFKTFKPERVKGNNEFLEELKTLAADIFVVVAYGTIMPSEVINLPPLKTVNVHFSALPKYRGPSPIQSTLLNGEGQTGTSIFILNEGIDSGPLLAQKIVNIEPDDNFFTLSDRLAHVSADLLLQTLSDYQSGKITPLPQDESQASFTKIISKQNGKIEWQKTAQEIYNQFRAFYPWPGIWTEWNGRKLKILDCLPINRINELNESTNNNESANTRQGTVLKGGQVVCGQNTILQIKTLQPEGKSDMAMADFLNGYRDFVGSKLD